MVPERGMRTRRTAISVRPRAEMIRIRSLMLFGVVAAILFFAADRLAVLRFAAANRHAAATMHAKSALRAEKHLKSATHEEVKKWLRRSIAYHQELERKYRTAASWPWTTITPDPPIPEFPLSELIRQAESAESQ